MAPQDQFYGTAQIAGIGVNGGTYTFMRWDSYDPARGPVDLNNVYADLSVRTTRQVKWEWGEDERVTRVPEYSDSPGWNENGPTGDWEIVPRG